MQLTGFFPELKDERAGPPRFLRCLRDIWTLLGDEVVFEVEVAGYPAPDLTWYHQDKRVMEGKNVKVSAAIVAVHSDYISTTETVINLHLHEASGAIRF